MPTSKLNLPTIDNTKTADVVRDMNALANAVDTAAGTAGGLATLDPSGKVPSTQLDISAPADATTSTKGIVMLEDSITSTSVTKAATPKSVKAVSEQVGTLTTLNTTAKNNLVAAVNELFQFANDGKTAVANAVTAKGVPASSTDTFSALATKIGQISTGKKFATGTTSYSPVLGSFENAQNTVVYNDLYKLTVSGLNFKPSFIYAFNNRVQAPANITSIIYTELVGDVYPKLMRLSYTDVSNMGAPRSFKGDKQSANVSLGGFTIPCTAAGSFTWIAVE